MTLLGGQRIIEHDINEHDSDLDREVTTIAYGGLRTVRGNGVEAVPAYNRTDGPNVDEDGDPFHAEREVVGLLLDISNQQ